VLRLQPVALRSRSRVRSSSPRCPHLVHHLRAEASQEAAVNHQRHVGQLAQVRP